MPYFSPEVVQKVKRIDLLTYLKTYEPYELVRFSSNTYTTRTHDSLKISNGRWMWWSRGIGGRTALDYLIKVRDYTFLEAMELITGQASIRPAIPLSVEKETEKKLLLPEKYHSQTHVASYLTGRGIDIGLINFCIRTGRIYESAKHHNAVFVGRDRGGTPRYAALRGIGTDFIGEASGSDKNYSFSIPAEKSTEVHLFESAVDLLSYATLLKKDSQDWQRGHLLSLAGIYQPAKKIEESKVPAALARFLKEHPEVKEIKLHLDNDNGGRLATKAVRTVLPGHYRTEDQPPPVGKDYNDYLCIRSGLALTKRVKRNEKSFER